jgi:hypothetical protein
VKNLSIILAIILLSSCSGMGSSVSRGSSGSSGSGVSSGSSNQSGTIGAWERSTDQNNPYHGG